MNKKQSGITLVSLAVTIVVMLILSAIALNLSIGDKGLIGQTQNVINGYYDSTDQEQNSINQFVDEFNEIINGGNSEDEDDTNIKEKPTIEIVSWNKVGGLVNITINGSYTTEYKIGNGSWEKYQNTNVEVKNGLTIYARYVDTEGNISATVSKIIKDDIPPRLTAKISGTTPTTTTVTASATDNEMGMPSPVEYLYYIKEQNQNDYVYKGKSNNGQYTYTDLNSSTIYDIMITAKDIAGNVGTIKISTETGEEETPNLIIGKNIFFDLNPTGPTKDNVNVSIRTSNVSSNYYIEYSINNESNYQRYSKTFTMTDNGRVYAKVTNGSKTSNSVYVDVNNIDRDAPNINIQVQNKTDKDITIKATATDTGLGMPSTITYKYYIKIKEQEEYQYKEENSTGIYNFEGLSEDTTYDIKVTASDKAGNEGSKEIEAKTNIILPPELEVDKNIFFEVNPTEPTKDSVNVTITSKGIESKFYIEYSINDENNYKKYSEPVNMTSNGRVYARVTDGKNHSNSVYKDVTNIDKIAPTGTLNISGTTTKSMTATVSGVSDTGLGMPSTVQYNYYIRKSNGSYGAASYTGQNTSYTFTNLDHNINYEVKVTFTDKAGNEAVLTKTQKTTKVPDLTESNTTFKLSETRITNKPITVEITSTVSGYTLQYSTDGTSYQNYTSPITIDRNLTIYARLWDDRDSTGNYGIATTKAITNVDTSLSDLEILIRRDEFVADNTPVTDSQGNKITIPEGFKPKDDATTIDKGIVVEDKNGNQFVWIPVGQLKTTTGSTVTINYDRYAYSNWKTNGIDGDTNSTKIQTTAEATEYFAETLNQSEKNSAVTNGGFYLGRYEAGTTHERTSATGTQDPLQIKQNSNIYNWVNQGEAKNLAQSMYSSSNYTSNLTSSYAWDTALKFLEQTGNTSYLTDSVQGNYYNTQHGGKGQANANVLLTAGETQKVNNLYDLGGNVYEWTTEKYSNFETNRVARGGFFGFNSSDEPVIGRFSSVNTGDSAIGFRVALFIGKVNKAKSSLEIARDNQTTFNEDTDLKDDNGDIIRIPKGFKVATDSEIIIDKGIVIEEVGKENQFVWVPVNNPDTLFVDQNQALTLPDVTTERYSKFIIRDADKTEYSQDIPSGAGIREPDTLRDYDTQKEYCYDILGFYAPTDMAQAFVDDYKTMSDSLKKYHGFYIGRYELTGNVDNPTVKPGKPIVLQNWYNLYKASKKVVGAQTVRSTMIYGIQWDATMEWLKNTKFKNDKDKVDVDSSSWGNYTNTAVEDTGSNPKYEANKIFDLAGNCFEATQEAFFSGSRIFRGGAHNNSVPASGRGALGPNYDMYDYNGTRAVIYFNN